MGRLGSATRMLFAGTALVMLAACTSSGTDGTAANQEDLEGVFWVLVDMEQDGETTAPLESSRIDLVLEGQSASGSSGCNSYSGEYTLTQDGISFGQMATTLKACPQPLMEQEQTYLTVLQAAEEATLDGDTLTLSGPEGTLVFSSEGAPTLSGTTWEMLSHNNGKQAVVSKTADTTVTAAFAQDGRVSGFGGCNDYTGPFEETGTSISIGPLASTQKMCIDAEVMEQERLFLRALENAETYEVRGDDLTLRNDDGATQATFRRSDSPQSSP
jgi:heat shock protein HslJ